MKDLTIKQMQCHLLMAMQRNKMCKCEICLSCSSDDSILVVFLCKSPITIHIGLSNTKKERNEKFKMAMDICIGKSEI